jgi:hypothetical protein
LQKGLKTAASGRHAAASGKTRKAVFQLFIRKMKNCTFSSIIVPHEGKSLSSRQTRFLLSDAAADQ